MTVLGEEEYRKDFHWFKINSKQIVTETVNTMIYTG